MGVQMGACTLATYRALALGVKSCVGLKLAMTVALCCAPLHIGCKIGPFVFKHVIDQKVCISCYIDVFFFPSIITNNSNNRDKKQYKSDTNFFIYIWNSFGPKRRKIKWFKLPWSMLHDGRILLELGFWIGFPVQERSRSLLNHNGAVGL